jgi:hypothetical protein
VVSKSDEALE